jgi:hypothetical protein
MSTRTAASTANYLRLQAAMKPVTDALMRAMRPFLFSFGNPAPVPETDVAALRTAIDAALPLLEFQFPDPKRQLPAKLATRLRNFRKMLTRMRDATNGEALVSVFEDMSGKTTDAWQKYLEYRDEALAIVNSLDEELLPAITVGPYTVQPFNTGRGDWDDEKRDTVRYVLTRGAKMLEEHGLGRYVGGAVLAYPTRILPPSAGGGGSALAMYRRTDDIMWIAAAGDPKRVLQSFIHETGHRVYWKYIGNVGRAAWESYFEEDTGTPDVDAVIRAWEAWATASAAPTESMGASKSIDEWDRRMYGRFLAYWMKHLLETGQRDLAMWTEIIVDKAGVEEKYDPMREAPRKGQVPGLDQIIAKRGEIRAYMTPVTAYSATSAGELFAEAFAHYIVDGPTRLHPRLRAVLRQAVPIMRVASGGPLSLRPDYGESDAALPRGDGPCAPSARRVASRWSSGR